MDPQDTEITLGTTKLLGLFFGLVMVCAVFFALGYTLGRKADVGIASASAAAPLQTASNSSKPAVSASQPAQPMTFYKSVEQKDATAQLTPSPDAGSAKSGSPNSTAANQSAPVSSPAAQGSSSPSSNPPDPMAAIPAGGYFVQVAAVTKRDDADALVDALKKRQYPAFVSDGSSTDKLFRVQLGPFADIKEAEGTRTRLIDDGYNPILKK